MGAHQPSFSPPNIIGTFGYTTHRCLHIHISPKSRKMRFSFKEALKTVLRISPDGPTYRDASEYFESVEKDARSTFPNVSERAIKWMVHESYPSYHRAFSLGKAAWYKYLGLPKAYPDSILYIGLDLDIVSLWSNSSQQCSRFIPREDFTPSMYRDYIKCVQKMREEFGAEPLPRYILEAEEGLGASSSSSSALGEMHVVVVEMMKGYCGFAEDPFDDASAVEG
ncbi:hypothetical protein B0T14DRAFT_207258 [Immersiella caudata]|uniref:Uncharacterized protein n=1 Tax=Immersiella caudata TaxID=314043 RepID=A0AA40BZM1_9PEZI|nr:hypothetical protein B0T14DRAFT_207258 [Immersiella caudata]